MSNFPQPRTGLVYPASRMVGAESRWLRACDADDAESIVLHEASFGRSTRELFLFACAIKYAAAKGKHVHVAAGSGRTKRTPEKVLPSATLGTVYREITVS